MIRLHLGCGEVIKEGYINVDIRPLPGVNLVADITEPLPGIPLASSSRIEAYDVLEHIAQDSVLATLQLWVSYLAPGGSIVIRVPDIEAIGRALLEGELPAHTAQWLLYGGQENEFDFHKSGFTSGLLEGLLLGAGCNKILQRIHEDHNLTIVGGKDL